MLLLVCLLQFLGPAYITSVGTSFPHPLRIVMHAEPLHLPGSNVQKLVLIALPSPRISIPFIEITIEAK